MIADNTPPVIASGPSANFAGTSAFINWTTDEFTTYVLRYGTSSGSYPDQASSATFSKEQQAVLSGLSSSETYYYQIISTDLSRNQSTSQEYVLEGEYYIYLPAIIR